MTRTRTRKPAIMKFILGMSLGIALGALVFVLRRGTPEPEHVCVTRPAHAESLRRSYAELAREGAPADIEKPSREDAAPARESSEEERSRERRREARSAFLRHALLGDGATRLPSARRCLADQEFNPNGTRIEDERLIRELDRLISAQNERLTRIGDQYAELTDSVLRAKLEAGIDPPSAWKSVPAEEVLHKARQVSISDTNAPMVTTGTLLRRGESPELEVLQEELERARIEARDLVVTWIASSGR